LAILDEDLAMISGLQLVHLFSQNSSTDEITLCLACSIKFEINERGIDFHPLEKSNIRKELRNVLHKKYFQ
jgi:hypothetical protein